MKTSIVVVALAACVAAVGCGGGGDSTALTARSYKAEADAICKQAVQEWAALFQKVSAENENASELPKAAQDKLLVDEIILPPLEKLVSGLSRLEGPAEGSDKIEAALANFETTMEMGQTNPEELASGQPLAEAREEAAAAGLKSCAP